MEYVSYSRLSLHDTCGLRFYYEYVAMLPPEDIVPTYHASFGRLLHSLYEEHANRLGECSYDELKTQFDGRFPELVHEFPTREMAVQFYKKGLLAISRFSRYIVTDVVASEQEFVVSVVDGVPPVKGFIDRLLHTEEHGYMVADLKTGKSFTGRDRRKFRQLALYSLACESLHGEPAKSGYFDFVVQGERAWVDISEKDRAEVRDWVREKWQQIEQEEFEPHYSPGFCSAYCPYRTRCPEFSRQVARKQTAASKSSMR